jgi:hypothetical protein
MLTPDAPLTYLDRMVAYVAPTWALRRARHRRTLYLEAQRALGLVRWEDGRPWVRSADGSGDWVPLSGHPPSSSPPVVGPGWRASTWLGPRRPDDAARPRRFQRMP